MKSCNQENGNVSDIGTDVLASTFIGKSWQLNQQGQHLI